MSEIKEYVLVLATQVPPQDSPKIIVIERVKQDWQFSRLNLPGGHIEPGETPEQAAVRELDEETGIVASIADTRVLGVMEGSQSWRVYCCLCPWRPTLSGTKQVPHTSEQQPVYQMDWNELRSDLRLIPNLTILIPMMQARVSGWKLLAGANEHEWTLTLAGAP